jgi:hypothetical protein
VNLWEQLTAIDFAKDIVALAEEYDNEEDFLLHSTQFGKNVQDKLSEYTELNYKGSES